MAVTTAPKVNQKSSTKAEPYDLKNTVVRNRLLGLWRMMIGYRGYYIGATLALAVAALAKTSTYMLLRYFVDTFFVAKKGQGDLLLVAGGFVGLALIEGSFTFISGALAARTAESVTRRLRDYLYDHIQHLPFFYHKRTETGELIQRCTSDVDALRRFYADQAIGIGRIILLFTINFIAILQLNTTLGLVSVIVVPFVVVVSAFFLSGSQSPTKNTRSKRPPSPPPCKKI